MAPESENQEELVDILTKKLGEERYEKLRGPFLCFYLEKRCLFAANSIFFLAGHMRTLVGQFRSRTEWYKDQLVRPPTPSSDALR